jgi:hypothetical protein
MSCVDVFLSSADSVREIEGFRALQYQSNRIDEARSFWEKVQNKYLSEENVQLTKFTDQKKTALNKLIKNGIIFAFYEALPLTTLAVDGGSNSYMELCRAFTIPAMHAIKAVVIVIDTNSKITNFSPRPKYHPSSRVSRQGHSTVPPFYLFPLTLAFSNKSKMTGKRDLSGTVKAGSAWKNFRLSVSLPLNNNNEVFTVRLNPFTLVIDSRPLFSAWVENTILESMDASQMLVQFAEVRKFAAARTG